MNSRSSHRLCAFDRCPGNLPEFCIEDDGYHPTCREEMNRIETPHGTWVKVNSLAELAVRLGLDLSRNLK